MAENQTKTKSSTKQNVVLSRRTHHKHDTAPLSLYNRHTITLCLVSDHKNRGQKIWVKVTVRPGPGSDRAVLAQGEGGYHPLVIAVSCRDARCLLWHFCVRASPFPLRKHGPDPQKQQQHGVAVLSHNPTMAVTPGIPPAGNHRSNSSKRGGAAATSA